jgi:DUF2945 family protein
VPRCSGMTILEVRMAKSLKSGDRVSWQSHGGTAHGKVVKKLTEPMKIHGHRVAASTDNPEYLVETGEGKRAAHKPGVLRKS